jgi:tetratricopeptide (TPR) repeat protein
MFFISTTIHNRITLNQQTRRIQPYSVSDGEYVTLVEFVLEAARTLDLSFNPTRVWSERSTEYIPNESEITRFSLGEKPLLVEIIYRKLYEHGVDPHQEDTAVVCKGLKEGLSLELCTVRSQSKPRFIEIRVSGPQSELDLILKEFERRFRDEHIPQEKQPEYFLRIAEAATSVGAWRVVELNAQEVFKYDPNSTMALMYLGVARAEQGFEPEGENQLLASLTLDPRNAQAYYHLGLIVMRQGRCILASNAFRKGLTLDPSSHPLHYRLGQALERLGNLDEALESYGQALRYRPEIGQEWVHIESDFTKQAIESIDRVKVGITNLQSCNDAHDDE